MSFVGRDTAALRTEEEGLPLGRAQCTAQEERADAVEVLVRPLDGHTVLAMLDGVLQQRG